MSQHLGFFNNTWVSLRNSRWDVHMDLVDVVIYEMFDFFFGETTKNTL